MAIPTCLVSGVEYPLPTTKYKGSLDAVRTFVSRDAKDYINKKMLEERGDVRVLYRWRVNLPEKTWWYQYRDLTETGEVWFDLFSIQEA